MMKAKHLYYLLVSLLFAMGCMVGKKYTTPEAPANFQYRDTVRTDTTALVKWFELYKDTALKSMIRETLDSNRDLLSASARIEQARAQTAVIKANLYPQFNYAVQGGGGHAGIGAEKVAAGVQGGFLSAMGMVNWEIDFWGKLRHSSRSAVADFLSTIQNRNALQVSLVAEVASDYFLLRDLDNRLIIAQKTLANRKENTKIISDRFEKGYIAEIDKLQSIQQEAIAAATIPALERQIIQTENSLSLLMGRKPGSVARGYTNFEQVLSPEIPVGLPSQLLERRPDIMAAEKSLQAQFELVGVAQANRLPTISLTGLLGFASPELSTFISSSGFVANGFGSIAGPIFNFGQRKNKVIQERRRTEEVYYQYQKTVLQAFGDVDNALASYRTFNEELNQRSIQADVAAKALTLSRARYDNGYTSYTEVIFIENNLFDAQLQESQALQGKLSSLVFLYKSLGGGW